MKKRIFFVCLLCVIMIFSITGCGDKKNNDTNETETKVEDKIDYKNLDFSNLTIYNKKTQEFDSISASELFSINDSNSAKFDECYKSSKVKFVAKVYKIKSNTYVSDAVALGPIDILYTGSDNLKERLIVYLSKGQYDLASFNVGDLVYVESNIWKSELYGLTLIGINNEHVNEKSLKSTKIEIVNDKTNDEIELMLK